MNSKRIPVVVLERCVWPPQAAQTSHCVPSKFDPCSVTDCAQELNHNIKVLRKSAASPSAPASTKSKHKRTKTKNSSNRKFKSGGAKPVRNANTYNACDTESLIARNSEITVESSSNVETVCLFECDDRSVSIECPATDITGVQCLEMSNGYKTTPREHSVPGEYSVDNDDDENRVSSTSGGLAERDLAPPEAYYEDVSISYLVIHGQG